MSKKSVKKVVRKASRSPKKYTPKPKVKSKSQAKDDEPMVPQTSHDDEDYDLTKEEYEDKVEKKEAEPDVYTDEGREELIDDDEIDDAEEGFSKGASPDKKKHK